MPPCPIVDYKVQLEIFEGPLDLLLYLIKREEVDIYEVNLTKIATQFIEYVEMMKELDLDIAGDFLVMAATLMYIKSRELLPVDQQPHDPDQEDDFDPRWDLIRQLVEYKKFKDMAAELQQHELSQENTFRRQPGKTELPAAETNPRPTVSLFDLLNALDSVLKRFQKRELPQEIYSDKWTVSEKIQALIKTLAERSTLRFSELFAGANSRSEIVVTFLALLELIRLKQLFISQPEQFGEIEISRAQKSDPNQAPSPSAVIPGNTTQ